MFDSIKRILLQKTNYNQPSKSHQKSIQQVPTIMIELNDLNHNFQNFSCSCLILNPNAVLNTNQNMDQMLIINQQQLDEHVYEEIKDEKYIVIPQRYNNYHTFVCNCSNSSNVGQAIPSQQLYINDIDQNFTQNKNKKSVRFNSNKPITISSNCSSFKPVNNNNSSILKKNRPDRNSLTDSSDSTSSLNSPQILNQSSNTLENLKSSTNEFSSLSSCSSSFAGGIYNNNSMLSETSSNASSITSQHSLVFNQMIEEFLTHVSTTANNSNKSKQSNSSFKKKSNSDHLDSTSQLSNQNNVLLDQRLSFRVTNLSIDDLKRRQKLIYSMMENNSNNKNSANCLPVNV
jgi:hypothetical protein